MFFHLALNGGHAVAICMGYGKVLILLKDLWQGLSGGCGNDLFVKMFDPNPIEFVESRQVPHVIRAKKSDRTAGRQQAHALQS